MWNSIDLVAKSERLSSMPSLTDLLLPDERELNSTGYHELLAINTCNQLPLLSTTLLLSGEIGEERFRCDLDSVAFNCSSSNWLLKPS